MGSESLACPKCGRDTGVSGDALDAAMASGKTYFCTTCGTDLRVAAQPTQSADPPPPPPPTTQPAVPMASQVAPAPPAPTPLAPPAPAAKPWSGKIAGWLILPAIGIPLSILMNFFMDYGWQEWWSNRYVGELLLNRAFILWTLWVPFAVYVAVRFFGRKKGAPRLVQVLYGSGVVISLLQGLGLILVGRVEAAEVITMVVQGSLAAAIWIPYFAISKRVKATFVR